MKYVGECPIIIRVTHAKYFIVVPGGVPGANRVPGGVSRRSSLEEWNRVSRRGVSRCGASRREVSGGVERDIPVWCNNEESTVESSATNGEFITESSARNICATDETNVRSEHFRLM